MNNDLKKLILLGGDILILYFSLYLTLIIRYWGGYSEKIWSSHFWPFTAIFVIWIIIFYIANLYNLNLAVNNAKFYRLGARSLLLPAWWPLPSFIWRRQSASRQKPIYLFSSLSSPPCFIFGAIFTTGRLNHICPKPISALSAIIIWRRKLLKNSNKSLTWAIT